MHPREEEELVRSPICRTNQRGGKSCALGASETQLLIFVELCESVRIAVSCFVLLYCTVRTSMFVLDLSVGTRVDRRLVFGYISPDACMGTFLGHQNAPTTRGGSENHCSYCNSPYIRFIVRRDEFPWFPQDEGTVKGIDVGGNRKHRRQSDR